MYEDNLRFSPTVTYMPTPDEQQEHILPQQHTCIVDSGATHLCIDPYTPHVLLDTSAATISVGTENGQVKNSSATATLPIPQLSEYLPTTG